MMIDKHDDDSGVVDDDAYDGDRVNNDFEYN